MTDTEIKNQKLSNEELKELATGLENFGDMLIMMGTLATLEKELIGLDILMKKLFKPENRDLFQIMEGNQELWDKASALLAKWKVLEDKDPAKLSPDEQIEVGESFKGFSSVLSQVVEGM
ncbi:MAG TPA: hypothetical protein VMW40_07085, partial [Candidatus Bathyarchaeia archaeon]|nr:hypothetical protein [Candidatus Bathyarchaeia archaeon]